MLMRFRSVLRQGRNHRFVTLLLVTGYALGITFATLVYAAIQGNASLETKVSLGDPDRVISAVIAAAEGDIPVEPGTWTEGVAVSWGWAYLGGRGGLLTSSLAGKNVLALFGDGPVDWNPPMQSGRFLEASDLRSAARVIVAGSKTALENADYRVVGVAFDEPGRKRGWDNSVFVPFNSLPHEMRSRGGNQVILQIEIAPGQDLAKSKQRIESNLSTSLPGKIIDVSTVEDRIQGVAGGYRRAYATGLGFSGMVLLFVIANVGTLTVHWITQRRQEIGVRLAMGATPAQIVRMVLLENGVLGLLGGIVSVPMIWAGAWAATSGEIPMALSGAATWVAAITTLLCGLLSSVLPLYIFFRIPLRENLRLQD